MKTKFGDKMIMFEKALEFKHAIICIIGGKGH